MVTKDRTNGKAKHLNLKAADSRIQKADTGKFKLPYSELCWECGVQLPDFETTNDIQPLDQSVLIGQPRAEMSLESGLNTPGHLYVAGMDNTHSSFVKRVKTFASLSLVPCVGDMVCVHNFEDSDRSEFVYLPKGTAKKFRQDI